MQRRKVTYQAQKKNEVWRAEVCDDCGHGKWNNKFWNLDFINKPITLRCPFYKDGEIGIIRGTQACCHFFKKTNDAYLYEQEK
jgi:hypothetical protein